VRWLRVEATGGLVRAAHIRLSRSAVNGRSPKPAEGRSRLAAQTDLARRMTPVPLILQTGRLPPIA
jgi:hypothetical protein